jgi:hypothetical protein
MRDSEAQLGDRNMQGEGSPADRSRRAFVKRAALVGLPVVLATIPSRTVWAKPRPAAGKGAGVAALDAASAGGSVNPSGNTGTVQSLFR